MKPQLLLHCGDREVTLEELQNIPLPDETKSYKPVAHYALVR